MNERRKERGEKHKIKKGKDNCGEDRKEVNWRVCA
jgi:hypothetical protein